MSESPLPSELPALRRFRLTWLDAAIVLLIIVTVTTAVLAFTRVRPRYTLMEFGKGKVFYSRDVTEAQARQAGELMTDVDIFPKTPAHVRLEKEGDGFTLRLVVQNGGENWPDFTAAWRMVARRLGAEVFNAPCRLICTDPEYRALREFPPE